MDIAAGEYIYTLDDARALLEAGAVDVLQADVTRCGGITGFLRIAALCEAHHVDLSGHCAPAIHLHVACAAPVCAISNGFMTMSVSNRCCSTERRKRRNGFIEPDMGRPGHGLAFKACDAERYKVSGGLE